MKLCNDVLSYKTIHNLPLNDTFSLILNALILLYQSVILQSVLKMVNILMYQMDF